VAHSRSICAALEAADLQEFERLGREVRFAAREPLFLEDEAAEAVYNVTEGVVRLCKLLPDGRRHVGDRPGILLRMNEFAARELNQAQEQMLLLGRRSAEEKVASFLVGWRARLVRAGGSAATIPLPMGRQDIADFLGLTIETVSRTLTKLERDGVIAIVRGGVRLRDAKRAKLLAAA